MNKNFKVVFSKARGALMVVNELTSSVQAKGTKTVIAATVASGSVRISVSGEVIPGAAQRGCPLYLRCSMPDLMR